MKLLAAALLALVPPLTAVHAVNSSGQIVIAVIGRSSGTPSTRLVHSGANAAARDLSAKEHLKIQVRWETPSAADPAQEQANLIQKLVLEGVDGIAVSPSDSRKLTAAINDAVDAGIPVACFNADATASKRFYYAGDSDAGTGELLMTELGKLLGGKGTIGILAGNPATPNLQRRTQGVKTTAAQHFPDVVVRNTFYCQEAPAAAAARIAKAMEDSPDLTGWILVGGWAMSAEKAFPWAPGKVQCVSIVSGPAQLHYVRDGYVPVAVMPPYYQWSYQAVSHLVAKIVHHTEPLNAAELFAPSLVTAANADDALQRMTEQLKDEHVDGSK